MHSDAKKYIHFPVQAEKGLGNYKTVMYKIKLIDMLRFVLNPPLLIVLLKDFSVFNAKIVSNT